MIKNLLLLICPLLLLLFGSCNRYDPAIKECFAAKSEILDSLELDSDCNRVIAAQPNIVRYDTDDITECFNLCNFIFRADSGYVSFRYDRASDVYDLFENRAPLQDTTYYKNEVQRFLKMMSALTAETEFAFGGYSNTKTPQTCFIVLYKNNKEYHLYCTPQKEKAIDDYKKEHPHVVIYEIYKNWVLFQLSESLCELHKNQCG